MMLDVQGYAADLPDPSGGLAGEPGFADELQGYLCFPWLAPGGDGKLE